MKRIPLNVGVESKRVLLDVKDVPRLKVVERLKLKPGRPPKPEGEPVQKRTVSSRAMSKFGGALRTRGRPVLTEQSVQIGRRNQKVTIDTMYKSTHPHQLYRMRLAGLPLDRIADIFMVSIQQIYTWRRQYPEFQEAWDEGGDHADAQVANAMFQRAVGYSHPAEKIVIDTKTGEIHRAEYTERFAPDTAAGQYWLNNRQPKRWKNRVENALTGPDGEALTAPTIIINPVMSLNQLAPIIDMTIEDEEIVPTQE